MCVHLQVEIQQVSSLLGPVVAAPLWSWSFSFQNQLKFGQNKHLYKTPLSKWLWFFLYSVHPFLFPENIFHLPTPMLAVLVILKRTLPFIFQKLSHCADLEES